MKRAINLNPELNPHPELKPRPLRLGEVLWDLFPHVAGCLFLLLLANLNPIVWPPPEGIATVLFPASIALAYVIPVGTAVMMQLSGYPLLQRITLLEWRESLWLSDIKPRPYLVSQFKSRAIFQSIPFGVGTLFCVSAVAFGITFLRAEKQPLAALGFGAAVIYGLFCLQFCALCAAHIGHLDRLRSLCRPDATDLSLHLISIKWMAIIGLTPPLNGAMGGLLGELATGLAAYGFGVPNDSPSSFYVRAATVFTYSLVMCTLISIILYRRLRASWQKAQEEFFRFE